MNPGKLDRRIVIQTATNTTDSSGGFTTVWTDTARIWASKSDQGGREFRAAGTLMAETTTVFGIRYFTGLTTQHGISYDGKFYDIVSIGEIGRREGMTIQAKERLPQ